MSELEFIVDQIKRSFDGEAWHGPALNEILSGIDAITAAKRPVANAHSIWELVLHITAWERVIAQRIATQRIVTLSDEQNFPGIRDQADSAWQQAVKNLRAAHDELVKVAST